MHTVQILINLVEDHQILAYLLIFFGLIFEGEVVVITTGVLAYLGALDFWVSLLFILAGGMMKALLGYYLGKILYKKCYRFNFFKYLERRVLYFMPRFRQKPFWSIFISKFIMGVNYLIVIFSGYSRINLSTFLKAEFSSTAIWAPLLLSIGFLFSQTALSISKDLNKFSLMILALVIVFLLLDKLVAALYRIFEYVKSGLSGDIENNGKK